MWELGGERLQAEAGVVKGLAAAGRWWNSVKLRREQWKVVREVGVLGLVPAWREERGVRVHWERGWRSRDRDCFCMGESQSEHARFSTYRFVSSRLSPPRPKLPNCIPTFSTLAPNELGMTTGWSVSLYRALLRWAAAVGRPVSLGEGVDVVA
jgi:hypothetical protein